MRDFHRRLAEISLRVLEGYGFVLAGGYALAAYGIGDRPSLDVDLFTSSADPDEFGEAVVALRAALAEAGFVVMDKRVRPLFVDIDVADLRTGENSDLQLGVNYREFPPYPIEIGPVLDVRDAVAGKMSALWSRGEARDYIDIDAVLESGRFTADQVLELADDQEATPMDRRLLGEQFRAAARWSETEYARYDADASTRKRIVARFAAWADELARSSDGDLPPEKNG